MSVQELPQLPTNGPIYVIGYVRVSGKRQETDGHSLEAQQKEIRKYCEERGWILLGIVVEVFSGWYLTERKKLTKMRDQYIKGEQVHVVLVWKLDRLSRDQNHMTLLAYEMAQHGVRLESVTENFDDSPTGILIRQVYSRASSLERTEIIERTKMGQHNRSDQGLLFGGGERELRVGLGGRGRSEKRTSSCQP
ncbi:MAG TPA: recombinase family protein [Ktedonobacteraceae bacterium]|nr:recombinase family protein [Ktedonobacteraceae bacterium]